MGSFQLSQLKPQDFCSVKHLYIHVPFCKQFCTYCDFTKTIYREKLFQDYLFALEEELRFFACLIKKVQTVYIGGGTPNACSYLELNNFFQIISKYISNQTIVEYTIECNPNVWNERHISLFKKYGINRVSIGIQTTNDLINRACNRFQTKKQSENVYLQLRAETNMKISFDFILNFFNQKSEDIYNDIIFIKKNMPDHISWYSLMLKKGTPLASKYNHLSENDAKFTNIVEKELEKIGFSHYEISNYSLNNNIAIHNMAYWLSACFLGVGWGASSMLKFKKNKMRIRRSLTGSFNEIKEEIIYLSNKEFYLQVLVMGLRLVNGINITIEPFQTAYQVYKNRIKDQIKKDNLILEKNFLKCTQKGIKFLDDILVSIMD